MHNQTTVRIRDPLILHIFNVLMLWSTQVWLFLCSMNFHDQHNCHAMKLAIRLENVYLAQRERSEVVCGLLEKPERLVNGVKIGGKGLVDHIKIRSDPLQLGNSWSSEDARLGLPNC